MIRHSTLAVHWNGSTPKFYTYHIQVSGFGSSCSRKTSFEPFIAWAVRSVNGKRPGPGISVCLLVLNYSNELNVLNVCISSQYSTQASAARLRICAEKWLLQIYFIVETRQYKFKNSRIFQTGCSDFLPFLWKVDPSIMAHWYPFRFRQKCLQIL